MNTPPQEGRIGSSADKIREKWNRITDDDLKAVGGKREKFLAKLQERYGYPRERAEKELIDFETEVMEHSGQEVPAHTR